MKKTPLLTQASLKSPLASNINLKNENSNSETNRVSDKINNVIKSVDIKDLIESTADDTKNDSVIDLSNSKALKNLISKAEANKVANKKSKTVKSSNSRILLGPSTLSSVPGGTCPCNLKAMYYCKECGYLLHGDCMKNGEKICISCAS